jgi:simple sugar transport system ATP-binding protein
VILISHRMDDVFYVCDRVMALFHGRNFAEAQLAATSRNEVIGWIMAPRDIRRASRMTGCTDPAGRRGMRRQ